MREILFRGKPKGGQWIIGDLLQYAGTAQIWVQEENGKNNYIVDPATVGQFTGWEDDNNVKIFDGDILQIDDPDQDELYTSTVRCEKGTYLVRVLGEDFDTCDIGYAMDQIWDMNDCKCIVIGNIHDTKEEE